jgi:hypothetical protein
MAEIREISHIAQKWSRVTPQRRPDYEFGVSNPRRDWASAAAAADSTWKEAITAAAAAGRFGKGVTKAGTAKWKDRAMKKGPSRFAEGVIIGMPDFQKGFAPYAETIKATILPERFPKGDPRNISRVGAIADALHKKRMDLLG